LEIVRHLLSEKFNVMVAEPNIAPIDQERLHIADIPLYPLADVIAKSDVIVLLVNHKEFTKINRSTLLESIFIDTCGAFR